MDSLEAELAGRMQRRYARLVGRGTTALYIALRALALVDKAGEVILPDMICSAVLDAVLLAGFVPVFADITRQRFGLNIDDVRRKISPHTRAALIPHVFGYVTTQPDDLDIPIIEDAVQGLGGKTPAGPVGTLSKIAFTSFHESKMIEGRGGLVVTDDPALWEAICSIDLDTIPMPSHDLSLRFRQYYHQIEAVRSTLICEFDRRDENIAAIRKDWATLSTRTVVRNEKAAYLHDRLSKFPELLRLPEIAAGDAIWRYTFAAPDETTAHWILRHLQSAGLSGSHLYPSLASIFEDRSALYSSKIAPALINLWVDADTSSAQLEKAVAVIAAAPYFYKSNGIPYSEISDI